ncbi:MAG: hypothetical protein EB084_21980 [Proteobacteria bacterium]|nr:hypothetical protein [Pseudomonadota bacterium]
MNSIRLPLSSSFLMAAARPVRPLTLQPADRARFGDRPSFISFQKSASLTAPKLDVKAAATVSPRPSWGQRLWYFATDALDAGRIFGAVGAAGWMGQVAQVSSMVWGPVFAGIGMAVGGIEIAASASAKTRSERVHRIIGGGLEMAVSGAALLSTTGLAPVSGAVATASLVGLKLLHDMLRRPAPEASRSA